MTTKNSISDFYEAKEQFYNLKKNGLVIFEHLNYIAILMSSLKLISVIFNQQILLNSFLPLFIYALPLLFSMASHTFLIKRKFTTCYILSFYCVPASVVLLGYYEQMTYLVLFQIAYGIVAFFILQKRSLIICSYIFSALTGLALGVKEIINTVNTSSYQIYLLIINFCIFFIPFYFVLGYIRGIIEHKQKSIKEKNKMLAIQNSVLAKQNKQLIEQEHLLALKHQSLTESIDFQNKIISILSHDIRIPLVSIRNILDSYFKQKIEKETLLEYLPDIEENIHYLYDLFEDMLSWSKEQKKQDKCEKDYLSLREISEEICHAYFGAANLKKIKLHNQINESKIVFANERYVKVILRNLISNAIKFTNVGGDIFIYSEKNDFFDIVSVKDTGNGISEENLSKIRSGLEITTKGTLDESGTGLGLYFCRDFANKSGGILFVKSEQGKGSTFSFTLPTLWKQVIQKAG